MQCWKDVNHGRHFEVVQVYNSRSTEMMRKRVYSGLWLVLGHKEATRYRTASSKHCTKYKDEDPHSINMYTPSVCHQHQTVVHSTRTAYITKQLRHSIEINYSMLTFYFIYHTHFSVAPSGGRAGLQLFMLTMQTKNQQKT